MDIVQKAANILARILCAVVALALISIAIVCFDTKLFGSYINLGLAILICIPLIWMAISGAEKVSLFFKQTWAGKTFNKIESFTNNKLQNNVQTEEDIRKSKELEEKIFRIAGKIFRPIFIIVIGLIIYNLIPNISDTPFAQLTISQLFKFILGIIVLILMTSWLFKGSDDEGYELWGSFGSVLVLIGIVVSAIIYSH
ncbi:MAG TPA: hypothetical protein P5262_01795 [Candidatus Moranbacteria bacterium]|nr:hypothetical protein [Candidatus Moranbacteria bacterium]